MIEKWWARKVPQYLGTYLAVGFGLLQFLAFIVSRYELGEHWVDKYLVVWLTLLPAVATAVYFGGKLRPNFAADNLNWAKLLVAGNVVASLALGGLLFNGTGAAQGQFVELTNEDGEQVSAVVPTLQKVKTLACFQFENETGDETRDWEGVAFSHLLSLDLEQRPEFYVVSEYTLNGYYNNVGLTAFKVPSVGMQREIAQKTRSDYFTRISYAQKGEEYEFKGQLYSTRDGKPLLDIEVTDQDPFLAIDEIKQQIVVNIPDAFEEVENQISLPAAALLTGNKEALEYFTQSRMAYYKNPTALEEVLALAKKAIELDPTCAICHFYVGDPLYGQGNRDEAISYIKNAIKYGASLPERMQFPFKEVLYNVTNKREAYLQLQEMRRKMFPYEFHAYKVLVPLCKANYGLDSAKVLLQEAIDYGNVEKGLLTLYDLQLDNEEYDEAEQTLDRLSREFPDRDQDKLKYATIYENQGRIEEAKAVLLKEETLDPLNMDIQRQLSYLDFKNLQVAKATERLEEGIQQSTTLTDSLSLLWIKVYFYRMTGQIEKALGTMATFEKYQVKRSPINRIIASTLSTKADMYLSIDQTEKISGLLAELTKYSPEATFTNDCSINMGALKRGYAMPMSSEDFTGCRANYESYGDAATDYFDMIASYQKEDYESCLKMLEANDGKMKELLLNNEDFFLAKIYARAGALDKAQAVVKKVIDRKTDDPLYYYLMASFLAETDKPSATEMLEIALQYWSGADPDYLPAQRAMALAESLGAEVN